MLYTFINIKAYMYIIKINLNNLFKCRIYIELCHT